MRTKLTTGLAGLCLGLTLGLSGASALDESAREKLGFSPEAAYAVALLDYENGRYAEARAALSRLAEIEHPGALYALGRMSQLGQGVYRNVEVAIGLYSRAANAGNADAQFALGALALYGDDEEGIAPDPDLALKWFHLAAENEHPPAQLQLARMHQDGVGAPLDDEIAAGWFERAAMNGDAEGQFSIGNAYLYGQGRERNEAQAARWFLAAADQGFVDAQYNLALLHSEGLGVVQNDIQAFQWMAKAAEGGVIEAQTAMGLLHYQGRGVAKSHETAAEWFERGAVAGDGEAQYLYAVVLARGEGVPQDYREAFTWASRSLKSADMDPQSREEREQLKAAISQQLSPQQRVSAEAALRVLE